MRVLIILIIIFSSLTPCEAFELFKKKDYKQHFIEDALQAERRNNDKSAFHSYEKALYYYKKDVQVIEAYAAFCERRKYFEKAQALYQRLYDLTKNPKYLFRKDISTIKNGNITTSQIQKMKKEHKRTPVQHAEINIALIYYYSFKGDWPNTKKACAEVDKQFIDKNVITSCIVSTEKTNDKKGSYRYYKRFSELYPKDISVVKKIIKLAEEFNDTKTEEKFVKRLSDFNPADKGIKYQLAGVYQKNGEFKKANKVYQELIAKGDNSQYVKDSYAYSLAQSKGIKPKIEPGKPYTYTPKPLTKKELMEKKMYEALSNKDYDKTISYLESLLKGSPRDTKLLKLRVDMAMAQNNYQDAIIYFQKLKKLNYPLSLEDEKLLAFSYSKTGNDQMALEVVENLIKTNPTDENLLNLALEYSMNEGKKSSNWDKSFLYLDKLLAIHTISEKLLKTQGDLYSLKKDFPSAIKSYEKLVENYPAPEHRMTLSNLYMANQEFAKAQAIIEPVYEANQYNPIVIDTYLNTLLAQKKIAQAYWLIKTHGLEQTASGSMVIGDMAMMDEDYYTAESNYKNALRFDPESPTILNKLGNSQRMMGNINKAESLYKKVLGKSPDNLDAKLGLGNIEMDRKNFDGAREIFNGILNESPDYRPAKMAIVHSYIANDDKMSGIESIDKIAPDDETKLLKAQTYYDMNMWSDSKEVLKGVATKEAEALKYKIRRDEAITVVPGYSFFFQQLAENFKLDYHKFGILMSKYTEGNRNVFMEYNNIIYSSGGLNQQNNVVNEFKAGTQARPSEKWEYRADFGVKAFQFGNGAMLITDSWIKHYVSDKLNIKLGAKRNNIEQSYLSAVGGLVDGVFTGRAADNKFYIEANGKLPHQFYTFGIGSFGVIYAQNLITNPYLEGMAGIGRLVYNNPKNKWINTVGLDLITYNSHYQYNLLKIFDSTGQLFGGYFSPSYFSANTLNIKLEGDIKKWNLKYGIKSFGGVQYSMDPDFTRLTWGVSPYISYKVNDNVSINMMYNHFTYADLQRDQFIINAVIRGFKKNAKN